MFKLGASQAWEDGLRYYLLGQDMPVMTLLLVSFVCVRHWISAGFEVPLIYVKRWGSEAGCLNHILLGRTNHLRRRNMS